MVLSTEDRARWREAAAGHALADWAEAEDFIVVVLDTLEAATTERDEARAEVARLREALRDLNSGDKEHWVDGNLSYVRMTASEMADYARAALEPPRG